MDNVAPRLLSMYHVTSQQGGGVANHLDHFIYSMIRTLHVFTRPQPDFPPVQDLPPDQR